MRETRSSKIPEGNDVKSGLNLKLIFISAVRPSKIPEDNDVNSLNDKSSEVSGKTVKNTRGQRC